jgi:4-diphosphocytidyl-2C-methyl-D-erythritol kinase
LHAVNDFEIVIPGAFPEVARARRAVAEAGNPLFALLSGSGGAVFAVHATRRAAEAAAAEASRRLPSCPFVAVSTLSRIPDPVLMGGGEPTNQE